MQLAVLAAGKTCASLAVQLKNALESDSFGFISGENNKDTVKLNIEREY